MTRWLKPWRSEAKVRANLRDGEARAVVSYAGQAFTEIAPLFGDQYGQILVGLNPKRRTCEP
ncbi:MAG: hypothetical protein R3F37_17590 [Candidatus Competibacteraceae bacterium]